METSSGAAAESSGRTRPNANTNRAHAVTATDTSGGAAHRCGSSTNRPMDGSADRRLAARQLLLLQATDRLRREVGRACQRQ
jgi:hypothetical protein